MLEQSADNFERSMWLVLLCINTAPMMPVFTTMMTDVEDTNILSWRNVIILHVSITFHVLLPTPQDAPVVFERCGFDPLLNYTVVLEDNTGMILDQRVVSSDSCNDSCSISFSPSSLAETCRVGVRANNAFAQSDTQYFFIG